MAKKNAQNANENCLICKAPKPGLQRGLCTAHYEKYRRAKAKIAEDDIPTWEAFLIENGQLLPDKREAKNVFIEAIQKLRASGLIKSGSDMPTAEPIGEGSTPVGRHRKKAKKIPSPEEVKETLKPKKSGKKQGGAG